MENDVPHQWGVFLVSEGQLVRSKHQWGERVADPLVSARTEVFSCRVQNLNHESEGLHQWTAAGNSKDTVTNQ